MLVNWVGVTTTDAKGEVTYDNAFVTSLPVTEDRAAEIVACARTRWKVQNQCSNVLKFNGYPVEYNFGYSRHNLATVLAAMNLLMFAVCDRLKQVWIDAGAVKRARKRSFETSASLPPTSSPPTGKPSCRP